MDNFLQEEWNRSEWQSVNLVFFKLFKEKLLLATNRTECTLVHPPKEFSSEALSMIIVLIIFGILAVLGSLSTVFEFLYEENIEKKIPSKNSFKMNFISGLSIEWMKKISGSDVNNKDCTKEMQRKESIFILRDCLKNIRSFLHCFCLIRNGKKLIQTDPGKNQFECFHGIRVISNFCLICFHIGLFSLHTRKMDEMKPFFQSTTSVLFLNSYYAVDAFFVLSGFLNAYSFSNDYDRNNGKISWMNFYVKRLLRLMPTYIVVLGFYTTLLSYTGSGPLWPKYATNPVCKENWWKYMLFINNFELSVKSCMIWCWHLAVEMQVYIISPIFLLSLHRWQRFGYSLACITFFLSSFSCFLISKRYNLIHCSFMHLRHFVGELETFLDRLWLYADLLYYKPYSRISPYLVGVLLGHNFYGNYKGIRIRWKTLCFGWITSAILTWISFFGLLNREESVLEAALHNSVKHLFFALGLAWIIYVCLTKQGSIINAFLSCKLFAPLSKLSYCAYLIHMLIIQRDYQVLQELEEFSPLALVLYVFRVYFWTFVISTPVWLLFEIPIINIFDLYKKKEDIGKRVVKEEKIKKK